ncbi:amino acid permease [Spiroplasma endosymbiont of Labia minor]|uniref:amino acid permease n=1 Tax=Spiroplasma endosymbiont of Labia minor TaxID=3066305 RepID=UPI0030D4B605
MTISNVNTKYDTKNSKRKVIFEFLTVFAAVFGTTVGVGIFIKNSSLLESAKNPFVIIGLWVIIGITCMTMLLSFLEIASAKKEGAWNLAAWSCAIMNRRAGSLISLFYLIIYAPIMNATLPLSASVFLFTTLNNWLGEGWINANTEVMLIMLITILQIGLTYILNNFLPNAAKWSITIINLAKFIPLCLVLIGGFVVMATPSSFLDENGNLSSSSRDFTMSGTLIAIPMVVFSIDGFLGSIAIEREIENKHIVSKASITAVAAFTLFYLIMSISIFFGTDNGDAFGLIMTICNNNIIAGNIIQMLVAIMAFGSALAMSVFGWVNIVSSSEMGLIAKKNQKVPFTRMQANSISFAISLAVGVIFMLTSYFAKKDSMFLEESAMSASDVVLWLLNTMSNAGVTLSFTIYLILIIAAIDNRYKKRVDVNKIKGGLFYMYFSAITLILSLVYTYYDIFASFAKPSLDDKLRSIFLIILVVIWGLSSFINEIELAKNNIEDEKSRWVLNIIYPTKKLTAEEKYQKFIDNKKRKIKSIS